MSCKVSIIIPVYNSELFMITCIESLMNQTLKECEYIFVNDGSTDNTRTILESYKSNNPKIKVLHQKNQGVSMARNSGIALAEGEFIGFVDSDDTIEPDMFERLYGAAIQFNCDVVVSNFENETGKHRGITSYSFPNNTRLDRDFISKQVLPYFLKADDLNTVCTKLYKAAVLREAKVVFPEKVALGEDGYFNIHFLSVADSMVYLNYTGYLYKERAGSATRNIGEKDYFKRAVEVYESTLPDVYRNRIDPVMIPSLKAVRLINTILSIIHIYFTPSSEVGFRARYRYIRKAISHRYVRESLAEYYRTEYTKQGRYQKWLVELIRLKWVPGLYTMTLYSRIRNK